MSIFDKDRRNEDVMRYRSPRLSPEYERETEDKFRNDDEAHALLDLINAEFKSDPMSVQCFDLRIVERVAACVASRAKYKRRWGL